MLGRLCTPSEESSPGWVIAYSKLDFVKSAALTNPVVTAFVTARTGAPNDLRLIRDGKGTPATSTPPAGPM